MMTPAPDPTPDPAAPSREAGPARLIVCEREGRWAVALRRDLPRPEVLLHETRSVEECWEALARWPASFVVVELTRANATAVLERMAWLERDFPLAGVAVVADRALGFCEWLIREAGAVHFTVSPRGLGPLGCLAVRHLDAAPPLRRPLTERIWASLPWG